MCSLHLAEKACANVRVCVCVRNVCGCMRVCMCVQNVCQPACVCGRLYVIIFVRHALNSPRMRKKNFNWGRAGNHFSYISSSSTSTSTSTSSKNIFGIVLLSHVVVTVLREVIYPWCANGMFGEVILTYANHYQFLPLLITSVFNAFCLLPCWYQSYCLAISNK